MTPAPPRKLKEDLAQRYLNSGWPDLLRETQSVFTLRADKIVDALSKAPDAQAWETWVGDELLEKDIYLVLKENRSWGPVALSLIGDIPRFAKALRTGRIGEDRPPKVTPKQAVGRTVWSHLSHERTRLLRGERAHPANQDDADLERLSGDAPTDEHLIARSDLINAGVSAADISRMPDVTEVRLHMQNVCKERLRKEKPEYHKAVEIKYGFIKDDGTLTRHRKDTDATRALEWLRRCLRKAFPAYLPT